ncbi:MAG: glutamine--fructose-6-phosphate transaminase (isomerizing) [Nanoarchaeota archaeon]|nr:glutamine--fructose-6-phosphate transaminase (isomerizing) [Nanoarchaeota archaeon]|tara:strand:+ start:470 stop:2245 length:1776 start_codon:yes stop_codon:yes gene_type:complete
MCGITGYFGLQNAVPILINGLQRLEYRGYDSAGIALLTDDIEVVKTKGKVVQLKSLAEGKQATIGIAHTRWATHGEPSPGNAHPHFSMDNSVAIVHNGIIENHSKLRKELKEKYNIEFSSETDSEVIAQLIQYFYEGDFEEAFRKMLTKIEGAFGIAAIHKNHKQIICARKGSPLVLGVGEHEVFIGSDPSPFLQYTKNVVYLNEKQMAVIDNSGYVIKNFDGYNVNVEIETVPFGIESIQKDGYEHFMLKEIHEQSKTIHDCFRGKIKFIESISINKENVKRIIFVACGTSYYSALVGKYILEKKCRIPVLVEHASEFRYREPMLFKTDLVIAVSQSGETADTLEAIRLAKRIGCSTAGIVNTTGSSIAKECGQGIYLHAGPEIGVASTKAFTSQIVAFILLSLYFSNDPYYQAEVTEELAQLPEKVKEFFQYQNVKSVAEKYTDAPYFLFMGRDIQYPVAMEGALKLKEISYIPAEGYPAGEMKHGPIALIDEKVPCVFIVNKDTLYDKVLSNMEEVRSRKGKIIVVCDEITEDLKRLADDIIVIPKVRWEFSPIITTIPLQLLAYHIAHSLGREIDQPRNLAKSVTVE